MCHYPLPNMPLFVTDFHGLYIFNGKEIVAMKTPIDNFIKQNQAFCAATDGNKIVYGTVARGIIIHDLEKRATLTSTLTQAYKTIRY